MSQEENQRKQKEDLLASLEKQLQKGEEQEKKEQDFIDILSEYRKIVENADKKGVSIIFFVSVIISQTTRFLLKKISQKEVYKIIENAVEIGEEMNKKDIEEGGKE